MKKGELVCELDSASLSDQLTNQKIATQGAEAAYQNAKLTREVAEIAVKEYVEGIFKQDKADHPGRDQAGRVRPEPGRGPPRLGQRGCSRRATSRRPRRSPTSSASQKAKFALEQAQTKLNVLEKYTKDKTIKELESEVEKAHSDELAKKQTYELEKDKEAKLEKQIVNCKLFAPGDGLVVYANDPSRFVRQQRSRRSRKGRRSASGRRSSACPTSPRCRSTPRSTSRDRPDHARLKARIRVDAFADQELDRHGRRTSPPCPTRPASSARTSRSTRPTSGSTTPLPGLRPGMTAAGRDPGRPSWTTS